MSDAKLWRRYRRLLLAYPRAYRRERGAEIATTLVDAAPPGQAWPRPREAADLLVRGLACRLRVRGPGAVVVAVLVTGYAAVALGALGGFLGWQSAPPLPGNADAVRIVGPALPPGAAVPAPTRWDFVFGDNPKYTDPPWVYLLGGTDEYQTGQVFLEVRDPALGARPAVDEAAARMRAAGWRVVAVPADSWPSAVAYRDGWRVELDGAGGESPGLRIALTRTTPGAVRLLTLAGLVLGGFAGWLTVAWAYRRGRRAGPMRRAATIVLCGAGLVALLPATGLSAVALVASLAPAPDPVPGWIGYVFLLARPLAYLGGLALLGALVVRATGRPGPRNAEILDARPPLTG